MRSSLETSILSRDISLAIISVLMRVEQRLSPPYNGIRKTVSVKSDLLWARDLHRLSCLHARRGEYQEPSP